MHDLAISMRGTFMDHMKPFVAPLMGYCPDQAPAALALLCDPRHRRGEVFYWMSDPLQPECVRRAMFHHLLDSYTEKHLLPYMVSLQMQ